MRGRYVRTQQDAQALWDLQRARMKGLRRALWVCGVFRIYADGDIFRPLLRWWHPVTWLIWIAMLPVAIVVPWFTSFTVVSIYGELPCRPVKYFRDHPDQLMFVK